MTATMDYELRAAFKRVCSAANYVIDPLGDGDRQKVARAIVELEELREAAKLRLLAAIDALPPLRVWTDEEHAQIAQCAAPHRDGPFRYCQFCPWTEQYATPGVEL